MEQVECEALITLLGFHSHLGAIAEWGIELEGKRQLKVDPTTMATTMPSVFAAGDVAGYPGKITLITIGMGEAAIAANNAIAQIRGEKVQPKYSTDLSGASDRISQAIPRSRVARPRRGADSRSDGPELPRMSRLRRPALCSSAGAQPPRDRRVPTVRLRRLGQARPT